MKPQDYSNKYFEHLGGGNGKVIVQEIPGNQGYFWIGEVFAGPLGAPQMGDQFFVAHESRLKPEKVGIQPELMPAVEAVRNKLENGTHKISNTRLCKVVEA